MKQYQDLLRKVFTTGVHKQPARPKMPCTVELFAQSMEFNLSEGFPILTTKRMSLKMIAVELLWFLKGDTNIRYLVQNKCHIWNDDAYRYYLSRVKYYNSSGQRIVEPLDKEDFICAVLDQSVNPIEGYKYGDLGAVYGQQWRAYKGLYDTRFDQIINLEQSLRNNPDSRYHIVTAWNPLNFLKYPHTAALPACHIMFQCCVREEDGLKYLDLMVIQRSCDMFLGVPFNISSYALLLSMLAITQGFTPGRLVWHGGSVHLYVNHFDAANTLLSREPLDKPTLVLPKKNSILDYTIEDIELINYNHHGVIKAPLSTGL